jgi:hypothetical protein
MLRASFRAVQLSLADDYPHVLLFRKLKYRNTLKQMKTTYMLAVLRLTERTPRPQPDAVAMLVGIEGGVVSGVAIWCATALVEGLTA